MEHRVFADIEAAKERYIQVLTRWDSTTPLTLSLIKRFLQASFEYSVARIAESSLYPQRKLEENLVGLRANVELLGNRSRGMQTPEERRAAIRWFEFQAMFERRKMVAIIKGVKEQTGLSGQELRRHLHECFEGQEIDGAKKNRARFWEAVGLLRSIDEDRMTDKETEFVDLIY